MAAMSGDNRKDLKMQDKAIGAKGAHEKKGAVPINSELGAQSSIKALLLLGVVGSLLAGQIILAKLAVPTGWAPLALLQWSLFGAAIIQFTILAVQGQRKSVDMKERVISELNTDLGQGKSQNFRQLATYMLITGLLFAAPNALAFAAAPHVGAGFISLCFAFPLVLTYGLSVLLGLETVNVRRLIGVGLGLVGGVALASKGLGQPSEAAIWVLVALAVPVIVSFGNVYRSLKWPKGASPALLSAGMMAFAAVAMSLLNWGLGVDILPAAKIWQAMVLLGAQTSVFALLYVLYFKLQKLAGPVYLSQMGSVAAVVGLALAFLVFHEVPGLEKVIAVIAIAMGIFFVSQFKRC
ncbi:DMT family transporter [Roseibium sp. H3510]|uniref:DMT family transporter n=2 Tax=Roseibium algae TaxID=3123038 RepID=A0ABU8TIQ9_9HYPH